MRVSFFRFAWQATCVSTDYLLTGQDGEQSGDVITMDSLRDIQKQVCGIMSQTNTLIAELEAKK